MRIKLTIEYDGTKFFGWQKQDEFNSVQETIEEAINSVINYQERVELFGAGRTDTGVHAKGQVAHFDLTAPELINKWKDNLGKFVLAVNFYLHDKGTVVISAEAAPDDFHARFSAQMRHYQYIIYNRDIKSVIYDNRVWHVATKLDENKMNAAAQDFIGTHNLNAFRSRHCNAKNPVRTISKISVHRDADFVIMDIAAKSFLHNQVRIIIGTLKDIGTGKLPPDAISALLKSQDRTQAGITAPPFGLYFMNVDY